MNKKLKIILGCIASLSLVACSAISSDPTTVTETSIETILTQDATFTALSFTQEDLNTDYNPSTVTTITLNGDSAFSDGVNAQVDGKVITILDEGEYLIQGSLDNGQIIVSAEATDQVHLILDNASIHSDVASPLVVLQADKTIITLQTNTVNTLEDATTYIQAEEEPNATLYSQDDLTINGTGTLNITAHYNHGIYSKNDLSILDATLVVEANNDGIKGKDLIEIRNATISITANGDGLQSSNAESTDVGSILIESGTFNITSGLDGLQAENRLEIQAGIFNLNTGSLADSESSGKALKALNLVLIQVGTFEVYSYDDAIHSDLDVVISGGSFNLESKDDGIHANHNLSLLGGSVHVLDAYEGLESSNILISGGDHSLVTYDDGINGSNGNDASASANQNDMFASDGSTFTITGGTLIVNAQGDGLDSNGSITMSGGTVVVYGPTDSGNGSLDYNAGFVLTGGTLVAVGSSGMAMNVSETTQNSVLVNFSGLSANERLSIVDTNGNIIVSLVLPKSAQSILYTGSNLVNGAYQLVYGGLTRESESVVYSGTLSEYTALESISISSSITNVGAASMGQAGQAPNGGTRPSRK